MSGLYLKALDSVHSVRMLQISLTGAVKTVVVRRIIHITFLSLLSFLSVGTPYWESY